MSERIAIGVPFLALALPGPAWARASTLLIVVEALVLLAGWGVAAAVLRELLRARRRLEAVARAEHELRGPAAVLLLACERMRREPASRRHAHALEVELARMGRGLSALTAARTGRRPTARASAMGEGDRRTLADGPLADGVPAGSESDLRTFTDGALAGWEPSLRAAGRPARFHWDAGRVGLPAQRGALASALGNLVANAAEHGEGPVEVRGSRVPGAVRVEIRNGASRPAGVPRDEARDRDRSPNRKRRRSQDRGQGLAIADEAAREAGATLAVERGEADFLAALEIPVDVAGTFERWFGGRPRDPDPGRPAPTPPSAPGRRP